MTEERKAPEALEPDTPGAAGRRQPGPDVARPDAERAEAGEPQAAEPEAEVAAPAKLEDEEVAESEPDHEAKLEHDLEELAAKAEKADEYLELAQRTKADFENYRKRASREAASAQERGIVKLALELLPAVDDLDRALQASDGTDGSDTLASGLKLVHSGVIAALARVGIEPYSPNGEQFDPQRH